MRENKEHILCHFSIVKDFAQVLDPRQGSIKIPGQTFFCLNELVVSSDRCCHCLPGRLDYSVLGWNVQLLKCEEREVFHTDTSLWWELWTNNMRTFFKNLLGKLLKWKMNLHCHSCSHEYSMEFSRIK